MYYKHSQISMAVLAIMALAGAILFISASNMSGESVWLICSVIGIVSILFSSMTIEVENSKISWFFGPKFWRKSVTVTDVLSAEEVKLRWFYGLGIRWILRGWLYNVSGLAAVELKFKDGKSIILGTNEPGVLIQAIKECSK